HDVAGMNAARELLLDTLEQPLGAIALYVDRNTGILGLKSPRYFLRHRQVHRRIPDDLSLLLRRCNQCRVYRSSRDGICQRDARRERNGGSCRRLLEKASARQQIAHFQVTTPLIAKSKIWKFLKPPRAARAA